MPSTHSITTNRVPSCSSHAIRRNDVRVFEGGQQPRLLEERLAPARLWSWGTLMASAPVEKQVAHQVHDPKVPRPMFRWIS